ncbi:DNA topoisomerase I, mitochondrial-like [Acanthaster planci]|uniref:DNA topoisomerase I n=1 Tax=Acanthaster planci TaxID=133434 RepID=A0A8B7YMK5_ACAPL|nr:DNA topoisomerase I, mitochondrial-like [Acanthaster planci]
MSSPKANEKSQNAVKDLKLQNHIKSSPQKIKPPSSGMANNHHSNSVSVKSSSQPQSIARPKEGSNSHSSSSKPHSNSHGKPASKPSSGGSGSHSSSKHSSSSKPPSSSSSSKGSVSLSTKPKEGSPSVSKLKVNSTPGSVKPSSDKHKSSSVPQKTSSSSGTPSQKSSSFVSSNKPKEGSASVKPKDPSQPKALESKPKDSSSKPKDGSSKPSSKALPSKSSSSSQVSKEKSHGKPSSERPKHPEGKSGSSDSESKKDKLPLNHESRKHKEGDKVKVKSEKHERKHSIKVAKDKSEVLSPSKIKKELVEIQPCEVGPPVDKHLAAAKVKKESDKYHSSKRPLEDSDDEKPLSARVEKVKKQKTESPSIKKIEVPQKRKHEASEDDERLFKKSKSDVKKSKDKTKDKTKDKGKDKGKGDKRDKEKGTKRKTKKEEEAAEVWKWWEEEPHPEGVKWIFLEHKGPVFAPPYEPLPNHVRFYYDGKPMKLSEKAEEVAGFYARMLDHEYTTRSVFNKNFFNDWKKEMTEEERKTVQSLSKCNFKEVHQYFLQKAEERRNMTKEEKQAIKQKNEELLQEYGFCSIDGHREKMGNFKIEPPGLFRGRGDHPKQGMLKKRVHPEDVIINCSKDSQIPVPPEGHRWKQVIHDNSVTWLCSWTENIQGAIKYVMLNPSSRLKGEKDWAKYEMARKLKKCVEKIRANYREDFKSKEMRIRQRAVALYFIDKLALRAGNEKEEGESADTVGCCSLRVEHLTLHEEKDGQEFVVEFDFLGKDSIRYQNSVPVEKRVFRNLKLFMENKQEGDDLFDRLTTSILNKHLQELMEGLTAKVFRTYNASSTLQNQLDELTIAEELVPAKILAYNRANRAVAILCNHQRAAPKTFDKQMENLQAKIKAKHEAIKKARKEFKAMKNEYKSSRNEKLKTALERKKTQVERLEEQLTKLEVSATDKEENKEIALGTSKLNYLDPRISVAWTKKWNVPIEKIYNRTQRDKFRWAIDMAGPDFVF